MNVEPKSAAACILVRGDAAPEILLARRNPELRFMPGHHVFPGGRIRDEEDRSRVMQAQDEREARAVQTAAREVFEETGLLCVRGVLPSPGSIRQMRLELLQDESRFTELLARHDLHLDARDFIPAGTWVTPAFSPIRFATQYFLYRVTDDQQEELLQGEIVGLDWLTAAEARRRWHRGELRLSTPVAYTLRQMAAVDVTSALRLLQRGTERVAGEHNWFEIRRGITLIPVKSPTIPPATHTNCLIIGENELYVIDPGAGDEQEVLHLTRQIDHLIELGGRCTAILLSHSHPDHIAAAEELRRRYQAPIMAHEAAAAQLSFPVDRLLQDGEVLLSGDDPQWQLQCIHTPGHDPGHLCFLELSTGSLLAGDMVANPGTIVVSRQWLGDMNDFMNSFDRLLEIDCKLIIPSHGHPAGDPHELIRQQRDHRLWREAKIKQAYEEGAATFSQLLTRAYDDVPENVRLLASHALDAHLARLGIDLAMEV